jgi:hypothetical protein
MIPPRLGRQWRRCRKNISYQPTSENELARAYLISGDTTQAVATLQHMVQIQSKTQKSMPVDWRLKPCSKKLNQMQKWKTNKRERREKRKIDSRCGRDKGMSNSWSFNRKGMAMGERESLQTRCVALLYLIDAKRQFLCP